MPRPLKIRVAADWEERISMFLQDAIAQPHREPEVCEELIEYIQHLVREDRASYRRKVFSIVHALFHARRKADRFSPRVLKGGENVERS
jgi:hypothetical protein